MSKKLSLVLIGVLFTVLLSQAVSGQAQKIVILFFDDGTLGQYTNALPILQKYEFHATFAIITTDIGLKWENATCMTSLQIMRLFGGGMEIASHSVNHPVLPYLDNATIMYELTYSKYTLESVLGRNGLRVVINTFVIPFDEGDGVRLKQLIYKVYKYYRPTVDKVNTLWVLNQSLETFKAQIAGRGSLAYVCYHRIDNSGVEWSTSISLFITEMGYLFDNNYKVVSYSEYLRK